MRHDINTDIKNSDLNYCIEEYVRSVEHREILRQRWFERKSIAQLAEIHHMSDTMIKRIVYGIGDNILIKASKM